MTKAANSLLQLISDNALEQIDTLLFRGVASDTSGERIYGGQVMAQAISAAQQSVESRFILHSFHCYFLRPGDHSLPVIYTVDPIRDGRSFTTRRVVASQKGQAIFNCSMSFQLDQPDISHQSAMPAVTPPEQLKSDAELYQAFMPSTGYVWPVEFRQVEPMDFLRPQAMEPISHTWFKTTAPIGDNPLVHQQLLAYASDNPILVTALRPHAETAFSPTMMTATLDHALWLHRPFRVDDWLLYEIKSDSVSGGRGISHGKIFNRQGELIASAIQEGLVRKIRPK